MNDLKLKAFDIASEVNKQLLTLSTAIITLSFTLSKDIISEFGDNSKYFLLIVWVLSIVSIISGIMTLMTFAGHLDPKQNETNQSASDTSADSMPEISPKIYEKNSTLFASIQIITFLIVLFIIILWGTITTFKTSKKILPNNHIIITKTYFGKDTTVYYDTLKIETRHTQTK